MSVSISAVFPPEPPSSDVEWYGHGLTEAEGLVEVTLFEPAFCQLDPNSESIPDTKTRHSVYLDLPYLCPLLVKFPLVC